jgi:DNA-directed RNA polymerase subunit RPC12/RpoP
MSDVNCPYCDAPIEINHDDGFGYQEGVLHQYECHKCDKTFVFETSIVFIYHPQKADCLNDGIHEWKPTHSYPKFFTKMVCVMCDKERDPTTEERQTHKIPTYEEYLEEAKKLNQ